MVSCLAGGKVDLAPIYEFAVGTRTRRGQPPKTFRGTLLHVAFYKKALDSAKVLLHLGAGTEEAESELGDRPLHVAVRVGSYSGVCLLLEKDADPTSSNRLGNTPLHLAAAAGKLHICRRLLQAGARATALNRLGETPWEMATLAGSQKCLACAEIIETYFQCHRRRVLVR
ncbi:uncharacterized protein LOC143033062 [Oratosquilla oratoria]|uniref:uncharacterized protein LOC143033062 n=1 Tax=Oratosquilla oratoria TaxID=337810 RepID=UPI003F75E7DF